jgi:hypothetical protein
MVDHALELNLSTHFRVQHGHARVLHVECNPSIVGVRQSHLSIQFDLTEQDAPQLWPRLSALVTTLRDFLPERRVTFGAEVATYRGEVHRVSISDGMENRLSVVFRIRTEDSTRVLKNSELTGTQIELLNSVTGTLSRHAWDRLKSELVPATPLIADRVFISYRTGHERFAASVADRLGQEGFKPWFDKWDTVAGDSLPRKIEEAFATSFAFVPVLTSDYPAGKWANAEMEAAITKRINSGYRIIPLLLQPGSEIPSLIAGPIRIDCTNHEPEAFESQMRELIRGLVGLVRNPYV